MERARKRYVGLDVHKDVLEYCILDAAGKKIDGGRIVCEQSVLTRFAMKTLSSKDHVALEATTNTWSIVDILEPHVEKIVIGNPLKTKAIAEAKVKTDKIDAMIHAQLLRCDFLPTVWIPDKKTRVLRRLSSFRKSLVQDATATKNRIKGVLNHLLFKHAVVWTKYGLAELKKLDIPSHECTIMDCEIAVLEHLEKQIETVELEIKKLAYEEENIRILMTLPGVDYNTAVAVIAAFGDISRFKDADHAASYLGLIPGTKKSVNTCHHGPITKAGSSLARTLLCEAAQHLSRNDGPLGVFVRRLLQKKIWNKAVVAGARKLATIAYHMLKNKEPYRYATVGRTRDKLSRLRTSVSDKRFEQQRYRYDEKLRGKIPKDNVSVRFIPPISEVYEREGLPPARSFSKLTDGEKRALKEMGLTERVQKAEKVQVIVKPKKSKKSLREKLEIGFLRHGQKCILCTKKPQVILGLGAVSKDTSLARLFLGELLLSSAASASPDMGIIGSGEGRGKSPSGSGYAPPILAGQIFSKISPKLTVFHLQSSEVRFRKLCCCDRRIDNPVILSAGFLRLLFPTRQIRTSTNLHPTNAKSTKLYRYFNSRLNSSIDAQVAANRVRASSFEGSMQAWFRVPQIMVSVSFPFLCRSRRTRLTGRRP